MYTLAVEATSNKQNGFGREDVSHEETEVTCMARKIQNPETLVSVNGVEIPVKDQWIWVLYDYKCLLCVYKPAVCLHEAPPKSKNPRWEEMPETRFPVCNQHHEQLHNMNWKVAGMMLTNNRRAYFPKAEEEIEKWKRQNLKSL